MNLSNMPELKLGIVAVSRDCFPMSLSENRRKAVVEAYKKNFNGEIYECQTVVESETDMLKAAEELREAGCENVKIVDGGITAMKDIGVDVKADIKAPEKSDIEVTELDQSHDIMTEELQKNYGEYTIVDTRTPKEYDGAVLYDEAQGGRLPGAVNIPYTELFQSDGTLKDNDAITKMFEEKGIKKDDKVVTYCTGGIRSAYVQLVLEMCGYEYTYNYGQSFWRWAVVGEVEK